MSTNLISSIDFRNKGVYSIGMSEIMEFQPEVAMNLVRSEQLTDILKESYKAGDWDSNMVTTSMMVRPKQLEMIRALAKANRLSQGDIIRIIIDEWTQTKLEVER